MLYEQYAKKIRRLARVRDNILRYKILILCCFAAILAVWAGFLITKGNITQPITGRDRYLYGDDLSFDAKALFSDVTYEYNVGGEWAEQPPVIPGEYQVRAVSSRSFGRKNYTEPFTFVIDKKDLKITLADRSVEWLELPSLKAVGLANGDSFEGAYAVMDMSGIGEKMADVDVSGVVIRNADGEDVTFVYNVSSVSASVDVTPIRISVTPEDVDKIYDGKPVGVGGFSVTSGSLAKGHSIDVELEVESLVDVGTTNIKAKNHVITAGDVDVTGNYEVLCYQGTAKVTPKDVTLVTQSYDKMYDGSSFGQDREFTTEGLVNGDYVAGEYWSYPTEAGSYENHLNYSIVTQRNGNTLDVSKNYNVTTQFGTLTIEKVSLEISVKDIEKTYDGVIVNVLEQGEQYSCKVTSDGQLRTDSSLTVRLTEEKVNATQGRVGFTVYTNVIAGYTDITPNYDITVKYQDGNSGYINILPYEVNIKTSDIEKVYDGNSVNPSYALEETDSIFISNLGHSMNIEPDDKYADAGEYSYAVKCTVKRSSQDMTGNYRFNVEGTNGERSKIVITKRPLSYETRDMRAEYSGLPHSFQTVICDDFAPGHSARATSYTEVTNVYMVDGKVQGKENEVEFTIVDRYGYDVTHNYDITCIRKGLITVYPRYISIRSASLSQYYNGSPVTGTNSVSVDRLVSGDRIDVKEYVAPTNVKRGIYGEVLSYVNEISFIIVNSSGEDISYNYAWGDKEGYGGSLSYGTITIIPRPLEIISDSLTKTYDRTPLLGTANGKGYTFGGRYGLVANHRIEESSFSITGKRTSVGYSQNTIIFNVEGFLEGIVFDADNQDVTYNYDVYYTEGTLEIQPIKLTFTPNYVGVVYDGKAHSANTVRITSGTLLNGDKVWSVASGSMTDAGESSSSVLAAVVFDDFGVCVWTGTSMRHCKFLDATKPMYVRVGATTNYLCIYSDGRVELVSGFSGSSNYTLYHTDEDGEQSGEGCYDITTQKGKIEIRKRKITLVCNSRTESYENVKELTGSWRIGSGELVAGHSLSAAATGFVNAKGQKETVTIDRDLIKVKGSDGNYYTHNYEFKIEEGVLELT